MECLQVFDDSVKVKCSFVETKWILKKIKLNSESDCSTDVAYSGTYDKGYSEIPHKVTEDTKSWQLLEYK